MIDPAHPLYGRQFPIISFSSQPGAQYVLVRYREHMALRIPLEATTLRATPLPVPTKLTVAAVQELISVAEAQEVLCPPIREPSGNISPQNCKAKFSPSSRSTSRR